MSFSVIFEIVYIQSLPKVPPPPAYLKNASEVWKTAKNEFNQFEENFFQLRIFLTRKAREDARGATLKFQMAGLILQSTSLERFLRDKNFVKKSFDLG